MDQDDLEFVEMNPEQSFHAVMQQIQQQYPSTDAIIHTGDLAQVPVKQTYTRYLSVYAESWYSLLSNSRQS